MRFSVAVIFGGIWNFFVTYWTLVHWLSVKNSYQFFLPIWVIKNYVLPKVNLWAIFPTYVYNMAHLVFSIVEFENVHFSRKRKVNLAEIIKKKWINKIKWEILYWKKCYLTLTIYIECNKIIQNITMLSDLKKS